jgi:hypothetical protein
MESLYPWHQVAWDISVDQGMTDFETCDGFIQQIANELCAHILNGKQSCWTKDGELVLTLYSSTAGMFKLPIFSP